MSAEKTQEKTPSAGEALPRPRTAWVLSDGKAGDEMQCLGIAEALGLTPEIRRVAPRRPWVWAMPWGQIDPAEAPSRPESPIRSPFPDLVIASGRRTVAYLRAIKRASKGACFTVYLKDPRCGTTAADLIWVPEHDRLRGENVIVTKTSPHRVSADLLNEARRAPRDEIAALPRPRIAVLVGGNSRRVKFRDADTEHLLACVASVTGDGPHGLMVTTSRRTPERLAIALRKALQNDAVFWWDGGGENPYIQMLAHADRIVVTGDSVNMVDEALACGCPVSVFLPSTADRRVRYRLERFAESGLIALWTPQGTSGRLENAPSAPLDSTPTIAAAVLDRFAVHRAAVHPASNTEHRT
ncbi:MAG: mitochondrial fission ELM1 family protein [Hyphomicrobiales bacterium]|nr:mitochondrial fission ELM1 family protein [Hyphomicrobiales bacterium]